MIHFTWYDLLGIAVAMPWLLIIWWVSGRKTDRWRRKSDPPRPRTK